MYFTISYAFSDGVNNYCFNIYPELEWNFNKGWGGKICGYYDEVIVFGHLNSFIFGHWFFDVLTPMMLLPEDVFNRAKVYITNHHDYLFETLMLLGKKRNDIIFYYANSESIFFGHRVYAFVPPSHISIFGSPLRKLARKLKDKMHIKDGPATKYMLMNRKACTRVISESSFNELKNYLDTEYSKYNWEVLIDNPLLKKSIKLWNKIKFIIAPTGSNLMFEIFMQKKSVIVSIQADVIDMAFHKAALTFDLLFVSFRIKGIDHFGGSNMIVSLSDAKRIIKVAMFACRYGKFPARSKYYNY